MGPAQALVSVNGVVVEPSRRGTDQYQERLCIALAQHIEPVHSTPDLAIEICASNQTVFSLRKLERHLEAGSKLGWLVIPEDRAVVVLTPNGPRTLMSGDTLRGDPLLPGFELALDELFR